MSASRHPYHVKSFGHPAEVFMEVKLTRLEFDRFKFAESIPGALTFGEFVALFADKPWMKAKESEIRKWFRETKSYARCSFIRLESRDPEAVLAQRVKREVADARHTA